MRPRLRVPRLALFLLGLMAFLLLNSRIGRTQTGVVFPGTAWQTRTPAEVGLNEAKLNEFIANLGSGSTGVIIRDGYLVASWGSSSGKFDWASAAKPVLSTLLMLALRDQLITSVDDPIRNWGWAVTASDWNLSLRQLANNVSGYARAEAPGQAWAYNDYAINLYAKTLERIFGESLNDALLQRLGALQFQDGSIFSSRGGYGVHTSPRDFARIGWLWLNRGNWNGQQILPTSYFDTYMRPQVPGNLPRTSAADGDYLGVGSIGGSSDQTGFGPGIYGFNWWFNASVGTSSTLAWPDAPLDTIQANGHWGIEVMTVFPSLRMVVAAKGNWGSFAPGVRTSMLNQNLRLLAEAAQDAGNPTNTPTPIPTNTFTPTDAPTASNTPSPTPTNTTDTSGYPRVLPGDSAQITFIESHAPANGLIHIHAEIITGGIAVNDMTWYVNGSFVNTERSAPYYLGGDNGGVPSGYPFTGEPITLRVVAQLSTGASVEAQTVYPPASGTPPTDTPTPTSTGTPISTNTATPTPTSTTDTSGYPRVLPGDSAQITFIESHAPANGLIHIHAEIITGGIAVNDMTWYVNGSFVNIERSAPYYLGGDNGGVPSGYPFTGEPITLRVVAQLSTGASVEAQTIYPPGSGTPPTDTPAPTDTPISTHTPTATNTINVSSYPHIIPGNNAQIAFVESHPPANGLVYIRAEIGGNITITHVTWYVDGSFVNSESAAPYYLGGDTEGVPSGFAFTGEFIMLRAIFQLSSGETISAGTIYPPGSGAELMPMNAPLQAPTLPPAAARLPEATAVTPNPPA